MIRVNRIFGQEQQDKEFSWNESFMFIFYEMKYPLKQNIQIKTEWTCSGFFTSMLISCLGAFQVSRIIPV